MTIRSDYKLGDALSQEKKKKEEKKKKKKKAPERGTIQ